jgi:hypothetical protein
MDQNVEKGAKRLFYATSIKKTAVRIIKVPSQEV